MAVDIQNLFNVELPQKIKDHPDKAKEIGAKFQINITGDGGGEWYIDASDSGPKAEAGNPGTAECTITMATEDFQKLAGRTRRPTGCSSSSRASSRSPATRCSR